MTKTSPPRGHAIRADELALRAALNVLRDSVEAGRMPSGQTLEPDARELHEQAVERLEEMLHQEQDKAQ